MVDQWVSAMEAVSAVEDVSGNASTLGGRLQCLFFHTFYLPFILDLNWIQSFLLMKL